MRISAAAVLLLLAAASPGWCQGEEDIMISDVPIFPNALIILDTSGSMAETPYRTESGDPVPVGTRPGKLDIKVDSCGRPFFDSSGSPKWIEVDRSAYDPFAKEVNPDTFLTGGNHPASKFYRAKLALSTVLPEVTSVGLGFATFLQMRIPRVQALYYRTKPAEEDGDTGSYEFRWIITPGDGRIKASAYAASRDSSQPSSSGNQQPAQYIDPITFQVTPFNALSNGAPYVVTDEALAFLSAGEPFFESEAPEAQYEPLPLNDKIFPMLPRTPHAEGDEWIRVTEPMNVRLSNGKTVTARPRSFDYTAIVYPNTVCETDQLHPHTWSYVHMVPGSEAWHGKQWPEQIQDDPRFPLEAEDPDENYLGMEFLPNGGPELTNFCGCESSASSMQDIHTNDPSAGDDHLFFIHLPDPSYDDDPDIVRTHRDAILARVSLERVTDPFFDCYVAAENEEDMFCEFCPNGKKGRPYRQFTCMPYTSSIACGGRSPLAASLQTACSYFLSYFDQDKRGRDHCRDNFIILLTDGRETCEEQHNTVKAAQQLYNLVWEKDGQTQKIPVRTYVLGFGLDEESKRFCNAIAKAGGTREAYFATSAKTAADALRSILGQGPQGLCTRSNPVIVGSEAVYTGFFELPAWKGHLKKYRLLEQWWRQESNQWYVEDLNWYEGKGNRPRGDLLDGDAAGRLSEQSANLRTLYTMDSASQRTGKRIEFAESNSAELVAAGMTITGFSDAAALISFVRDGGRFKTDHHGNSDSWKMGDLYHATPAIVAEPMCEELRTSDKVSKRLPVVLAGANDGMIHAFSDIDGTEVWGYIPRCVLGNLCKLKNGHHYFIDLDIKAADVLLAGAWKTMLLGGLRQGGHYYFALDITDTTQPLPLWEVTDPCLGQTWSAPSFGRLPGDRYVAVVGGGFDPADTVGNSLYVIDLETGTIPYAFTHVGDTDEDFPAQVQAVDLDEDGFVERVYCVSTKGKLYRLLIDRDNGVDDSVSMIFDPAVYDYSQTEKIEGMKDVLAVTRIVPEGAVLPDSSALQRPVFYAPSVMKTQYAPHNYLVHYGTGDERAVLASDSQDFFFEIEDRVALHGENQNAVCRWVYVFAPGEKCLSRPITFNDIVYCTTFTPTSTCGSGEGCVYGITITNRVEPRGEPGLHYDFNGAPLEEAVYRIGGISGIPSSPMVANGSVIGNSSLNPTRLWRLAIDEIPNRIRSWQELY